MKHRVLVVVKNGVADFVTDESIEVVIFNHDEFIGGSGTLPPPHFADLAEVMDAPCASSH